MAPVTPLKKSGTTTITKQGLASTKLTATVGPDGKTVFLGVPGQAVCWTKNAKTLRQDYGQMKHSPDGIDLEPLTVPKCVECAHCGWPVFVREAKVATRKTLARAGIDRSNEPKVDKKKKEGKEGGDGDEDDDGEVSNAESRDTVEVLNDENEQLRDKVSALEQDLEVLKEENQELQTELDGVKEELAQALEDIDKLEEAQVWWRDKNSTLRLDNQSLTLYIDRLAMRREHLETDLKLYITETLMLRKTLAKERRRRRLMLEKLEKELARRERLSVASALYGMWRTDARDIRLNRALRLLEQRRLREVGGLQALNISFWDQKIMLEHWVERLKKRLKDAAVRHLERCGADIFPFQSAHVFRAWTAIHPALHVENRLEETRQALGDTKEELVWYTQHLGAAHENLAIAVSERNRLLHEEEKLNNTITMLSAKLNISEADVREAEQRIEQEKKAEVERAVAAVEEKVLTLREEFAEQRKEMEEEIQALEARLAIAGGGSASGGGGGGGFAIPEVNRVVPKGTGTLCCGCLTQILHRTVRPLPPLEALQNLRLPAKTESRWESERRALFENEVSGMANPSDAVAVEMFETLKDPYCLQRLSMAPAHTKPSKRPKAAGKDDLASTQLQKATWSRFPQITGPETIKNSPRMKNSPRLGKTMKLNATMSSPTMRETFSRDFKRVFR